MLQALKKLFVFFSLSLRQKASIFLIVLQEINYDSARGGVSVITEKGEITTSYLLIQRARSSDSGQYTCSPSNANSKSVNVHILAGEFASFFLPSLLIENKISIVRVQSSVCGRWFFIAETFNEKKNAIKSIFFSQVNTRRPCTATKAPLCYWTLASCGA